MVKLYKGLDEEAASYEHANEITHSNDRDLIFPEIVTSKTNTMFSSPTSSKQVKPIFEDKELKAMIYVKVKGYVKGL